jgi:hypothetical protein
MLPSLSGANGVSGVVLRGVSSTGTVASAAVAIELPRCGSQGNVTGGTGVIVSGVNVDSTPVAVAFTTSYMKPGEVCSQPPPYTQAVLHNASFTAEVASGDADAAAVVLNSTYHAPDGLWMSEVTFTAFASASGGLSRARAEIQLPTQFVLTPTPKGPWVVSVVNVGVGADTAIINVSESVSLRVVGSSAIDALPFGGLVEFHLTAIKPSRTMTNFGGSTNVGVGGASMSNSTVAGCGSVCFRSAGECLNFCVGSRAVSGTDD